MFNNIFKKKRKYMTVTPNIKLSELEQKINETTAEKPHIPDGMWIKCSACGRISYKKDVEEKLLICQHCGEHFTMSPEERIQSIIDEGSFEEFDKEMRSTNPIGFKGYEEKLKKLEKETGSREAVITGRGRVNGENIIIAVMDSRFIMGSMGSVVGEKITRAVEKATMLKLPLIIFTASGGARMQEGMFSLMQMAKVSAAIARHNNAGLLYITVLTNPTTGGVTASFAMLGDIILAEPGAIVGFAGKRVIQQTIKQSLPEGFQTSEFLLEHGFIDKIVKRTQLRDTLAAILNLHCSGV